MIRVLLYQVKIQSLLKCLDLASPKADIINMH